MMTADWVPTAGAHFDDRNLQDGRRALSTARDRVDSEVGSMGKVSYSR